MTSQVLGRALGAQVPVSLDPQGCASCVPGPRTCIHRSFVLSSLAQTLSLHLAFLARAATDFRKSSFANNLKRTEKTTSLVPLIQQPVALAGLEGASWTPWGVSKDGAGPQGWMEEGRGTVGAPRHLEPGQRPQLTLCLCS